LPEIEFVVTPDSGQGARLDTVLAERVSGVTRSRVARLIADGAARVNGAVSRPGRKLKAGEVVRFEYDLPEAGPLEPQDIPLKVVYRDSDVLVIDKPAGLVVHPGAGNADGTLANALLYQFPETALVGPPDRPGIVHRLDKETSGVMIAARTPAAYDALVRQFQTREVWKTYLGLVYGRVTAPEGRISWPIGRHATDGKRISVKTRSPKDAETLYRVLRVFDDTTLLEIRPLTGRTHQIRVHLAAAGHPIVGDRLYGRKKASKKPARLFLHAHTISFVHPATGLRLEFVSPLPPELEAVLAGLDKSASAG